MSVPVCCSYLLSYIFFLVSRFMVCSIMESLKHKVSLIALQSLSLLRWGSRSMGWLLDYSILYKVALLDQKLLVVDQKCCLASLAGVSAVDDVPPDSYVLRSMSRRPRS
ncbi:hypothetical protein HID58_022266 [Brassica napus]|uniref:Secreted protein n=1 Tax=Brassica napus TaxID=3708 RepID=A0ABQ8CZ25_BRANA|nr:hypothetical protein HID58_022266 [Brassica napus]